MTGHAGMGDKTVAILGGRGMLGTDVAVVRTITGRISFPKK